MTHERIMRELRDANPVPDLSRPADADERFAQIVAQPGDPRLTSPHRPGIRQRLRLPRRVGAGRAAVSLLAAGAAAVVIIAVTQAGSPTPAQAHVLYRLAANSAMASPFTGRYVILSEVDTYSGLPGRTERITSVDEPQNGSGTAYSSGPDLSLPSERRTLGEAPKGLETLVDPVAFLYPERWYASLSTDPATLRAELLPIGVFVSSELGLSASGNSLAEVLDHGSGSAATNPTSAAVREDDIYEAAIDLLRSPLVQPALRSALYKVLATTSGTSVNAHATDPVGRPAIAMSRSFRQHGVQVRSVTYENPRTGAVLAQSSSRYGTDSPDTGTSTAIYQPVRSTDVMPSNPYGHSHARGPRR